MGNATVVNDTDDTISIQRVGDTITLRAEPGSVLQVSASEGGACAPRPAEPNAVVCTVTRPGVTITVLGVQRALPSAPPVAAAPPAPPPPPQVPAILLRAAQPTPAPVAVPAPVQASVAGTARTPAPAPVAQAAQGLPRSGTGMVADTADPALMFLGTGAFLTLIAGLGFSILRRQPGPAR